MKNSLNTQKNVIKQKKTKNLIESRKNAFFVHFSMQWVLQLDYMVLNIRQKSTKFFFCSLYAITSHLTQKKRNFFHICNVHVCESVFAVTATQLHCIGKYMYINIFFYFSSASFLYIFICAWQWWFDLFIYFSLCIYILLK